DVAVGTLEGPDAGDTQFIDEATLECPVHAFTATAGLRRVGDDVFDTEPLQRACDLGRSLWTRSPLRAPRTGGPTGTIGVERLGQSVVREHRVERRQHGVRRLTLAQPC